MILLCEMIFDRGAHVPFNAGLLAAIRAAFPTEDLVFHGAEAHIEQLKRHVGPTLANSIVWKEIRPVQPGPTYGKRFIAELSIIQHLFREISPGTTSRLIMTSAFPSTVLAMKVARWFRSKGPAVQMVLHGLSGVIGKRHRHPRLRLQDMKMALTLFGNHRMQYLVLEESIRETVVKSVPQLRGTIEAFPHPVSPVEGAADILDLSEPIRFGLLGTALKSKGYPLFVDAANAITAQYGRRAEFHVIGRCPEESKGVKGIEALATPPAGSQLTREDFVRGVQPLHFVVLPYEVAPYSLSASGVFLDAIAWQKPVVARRIPTFEAMFEKHGDIGYLFSDDSELTGVIQQILQEADSSRYRRQARTLGDVRKSRDPETLAAAYRELCRANEGPSH